MATLRTKLAELERQLPEVPVQYNFLGRAEDPEEEANWVDVTIAGTACDDYHQVQRHKISWKVRRVRTDKYPPGADFRFL